ncbi:hypothetical protein PUNSTDRAFT_124404 [Punctularia strigosozonata HHB-11173 SS5]|uniref:uncharacterized protein n=1 Tax=Punctularia strigosozonata (strain HHB-11173) TaxID=741275 RepID=UPI00044183CC|nr:uncharacterized protein PUNSTDRAFT_124404 [Punctularia strigosozonata HHB-11173 SS5]EIN12644.1 hypothetical protein PUNSTDRAFT_124404 [Punctularia strigosozonata HHB-11173 SS5]
MEVKAVAGLDNHLPFFILDGAARSSATPPERIPHARKPSTLTATASTRTGISKMFSPRSANYERLEAGKGPSRNGARRFAWKKFAIGAVVIIGLVYVFGPRRSDLLKSNLPSWDMPETYDDDLEVTLPPSQPKTTDAVRPEPVDIHLPSSQGSERPLPTSMADDPDLTKTVRCTTAFGGKPLVQFALMIDAGSTGSRIHIYKFNNCGASPEYEYEVFKMTQPGLSSYAGSPGKAAESLDVLLDEAVRVVPASLRACTPVAVKATAGLRLLGTSESAAILDAVRAHLHTKYPFKLHDADGQGVLIMDGKDEGVYAWITANYLLRTIRADTPAGTPSYAVLDLGGASTQIVFEPTFDSSKPDSGLEEGEHKYDLEFGGKKRVLYQHSYLGYGLMRARKSVHRLVDFVASFRKPGTTVANPCLARGTERVVEVEDERSKTARNVTMVGEDIGSFEACNRVVELVMAKDAVCEVKPCSFDGVYQPSLMETFPSGKVLLLSYFFDRLDPLLSKSSTPVTVSSIADLATDVCLGRESWVKRWGNDKNAMDELEGRPEYCLDLTFMHALLRLGYEFDAERTVTIGKQIAGTELGWCLGATIAMVGGELTCRV